jgi:hypothetical protein
MSWLEAMHPHHVIRYTNNITITKYWNILHLSTE